MTDVEVHVDDRGETVFAGVAHFTRNRGRVTTTFTYAPGYLARPRAMSLDPRLELVSGSQYQPRLPGAFGDTAPDRWGRNLITKRERELAREQQRPPRNLDDVDFLLEVSDSTRQGALRFRLPGSREFVGAHADVPRIVSLPTLLRASEAAAADVDSAAAVKVLLEAGTGSLGGARPKAAVLLDDGALGLAKFPHAGDAWDVMAWEATALDLAAAAGINTPQHRLVRVADRSVLLLRRFDRSPTGERIGYISAMTALDSTDGEEHDYSELAARIVDLSASLQQDRWALFDRVALSVAVSNTDDHLRNHGFLASAGGWQLSPVFDINPDPNPSAVRRTSIAAATRIDDEPAGLLAFATDCALSPTDARTRLARVVDAVEGWRDAARRNGITEREQTLMDDAIGPRLAALRRLASTSTPATAARAEGATSLGSQPRDDRGRFGTRP